MISIPHEAERVLDLGCPGLCQKLYGLHASLYLQLRVPAEAHRTVRAGGKREEDDDGDDEEKKVEG